MEVTTIVVPDAAATPVNHTFSPTKVVGDTAFLSEKSASNSNGYWNLGLTQRAPLSGQTDKVWRTKVTLAIPVMFDETINGVVRSTLGFTMRANVEFVIPADATLQNRKDLRKILSGILDDPAFLDMVEQQNNFLV